MRTNIRQMRRRRRRRQKVRKLKKKLAATRDPAARRLLINKIWRISIYPPTDLPERDKILNN